MNIYVYIESEKNPYIHTIYTSMKAINHYRKNPLHVFILNSKTLNYDKVYVIINSPPPNVMKAIKGQRKNPDGFKNILSDYFGPSWKKLLNPSITGGANKLLSSFTEVPKGYEIVESSDDSVIYVDYSIYPEDSIITLKEKISLITGISSYRQHITINDNTTYKFILKDDLIIPSFQPEEKSEKLYGIYIDKNYEIFRGTIKIISFEHETLGSFLSENVPGTVERFRTPIQKIEIADFNNTFSEVISKPGVIDDPYQLDLLYYGASIKFWPQLSKDAFKTAITNQSIMTNLFPLLSPSPDILLKRFNIEKQLIEKTYEYANTPPKVYRVSNRPFSAISYTYVVNSEAMPTGINLRNIFDLYKLDKNTCVSRLFFKPIGETTYKNVIKKHILASAEIIKRVQEKALKESSVLIATETTTMTINIDKIYFEQIWKEDNRIEYKDAILEAEKKSKQMVDRINEMSVAAFPIGNKIPMEKHDKIIRSNISAFWPRVLSVNGFAEFKKLVQYYNGSIYEIRSSGAGSIILMFKKGMTDFDIPRLMKFYNRLKEDESIEYINTFSYLTNPIALKRWNLYYSGKTVRIYHKTSEIKIETLDVTIEEFEIIKRYFFTLLDLFIVKGNQGLIRLVHKQAPEYEKFLQRLREHDPELYDLRRHDKNANVYSVICQSGKQPFIYDEYDLKNVPQAKQRNLVKYWNFTENKPAYYECPYKEYPHLGFRSNEHPLGYCLPCCQKLTAIPGSKQDLINNICLKQHKIDEAAQAIIEEAEGNMEEISRHAIQYGKNIAPGRIGECPNLISNGFFYNAISKPYTVSLIGVKQFLPGTDSAGFFYSISYILNVFSEKLIEAFIEVIKHLESTYYTLGNGEANKFETSNDLINALKETYILGEHFTAFTQDIDPIPILIDLVYIRFGVCIAQIIDTKSINASNQQDFILKTNMYINSQVLSQSHKQFECGIVFKTINGYYPFAIINKRMYSKYPELTRRVFKMEYEVSGDIKPVQDSIAETISDIIKSNEKKILNLTAVKNFINSESKKYQLVTKLIGLEDLCYGVVIQFTKSKIQTYIPVSYSSHYVDGVPSIYGVRDPPAISRSELMILISDLNKYLKNNGFNEIIPAANLIRDDKIIGFSFDNLCYYHKPEVFNKGDSSRKQQNINILHPYDTANIDRTIFKYRGKSQSLDSNIESLALNELYDDYLYKLLLLEFASIIQNERNETLRKELILNIKKTDFKNSASLKKLSEFIIKRLEKFPNDQRTIKLAITDREEETVNFIHNNVFEFDSLIIQQLREEAKTPQDVIKGLDKLLRDKVYHPSKTENPSKQINNIYTSCNTPQEFCHGKKLIINQEKYNSFLEIMAQDVTNQLKNPSLFLIASGVQEQLKFIKQNDERILILGI